MGGIALGRLGLRPALVLKNLHAQIVKAYDLTFKIDFICWEDFLYLKEDKINKLFSKLQQFKVFNRKLIDFAYSGEFPSRRVCYQKRFFFLFFKYFFLR